MSVRFLAIMRHGEDVHDDLTPKGREAVVQTAEWLRREFGDVVVMILTSPSMRAVQTAQIVEQTMYGATTVQASCLTNSREEGRDLDSAIAFVQSLKRRDDLGAIVVVTHLAMTDDLARRYDGSHGRRNAECLLMEHGTWPYKSYVPT